MSPASDFDNNHIYSDSLSDSGTFDFNGIGAGVDGNIGADGTQDGATLTAPDANLLVEGAGVDAGIGADLDTLIYVTEDNVGPNSTWVAD
jgi:poly(beta-D-mannuronate) lyase